MDFHRPRVKQKLDGRQFVGRGIEGGLHNSLEDQLRSRALVMGSKHDAVRINGQQDEKIDNHGTLFAQCTKSVLTFFLTLVTAPEVEAVHSRTVFTPSIRNFSRQQK